MLYPRQKGKIVENASLRSCREVKTRKSRQNLCVVASLVRYKAIPKVLDRLKKLADISDLPKLARSAILLILYQGAKVRF